MIDDILHVASYWPQLLNGVLVTAALTLSAAIMGTVAGFLLSLARTSSSRIARGVSRLYIEVFRGTPVLIQLFWIVFCLPIVLGMTIGIYVSVLLSMTLYMTAITAETFRGALRSISDEQMDACVALGINRRVKMGYVIAPQACLAAIPPLLSNIVALFKESALVSSVGVADLMFVSSNISASTADPIPFLTAAALIYFAIAFPMTRVVAWGERRFLAMYR